MRILIAKGVLSHKPPEVKDGSSSQLIQHDQGEPSILEEFDYEIPETTRKSTTVNNTFYDKFFISNNNYPKYISWEHYV